MKKVTVNGNDHELSPDSPRSRSHVELLQDMVTSINNLETGTSPDGLELTSTDAAVNVITSASNDATTTASVAALTFKNTVAHTANDLEYNFKRSDDTSLLKIDKEGDTTVAGTVSVGGTSVAMTSTSANTITSATTDANTTASVAGLTFKNTAAHTVGDMEFAFQKSDGTSIVKIEDTGTIYSTGNFTNTGVQVTSSSATILERNGTQPLTIQGGKTDAADAVGVQLNSTYTYAAAGAKLVSIKNNGVEKAYFDKDGYLSSPSVNVTGTAGLVITGSTTTAVTLPAGSRLNWGSTNIEENGTVLTCGTTIASSTVQGRSGDPLLLRGREADGATAVGVALDAITALTVSGSKLVSVRNATAEKAYITKDGNYANLDVVGTAGSGTGISAVRTAQVRHVVHAVTVTEAALTDADTSQAVTIWTVPAKTRVLRVVADVTAAFTGGGNTACTLQVGISGGDTDAYLAAFDCFSGATTKGLIEADLGVALGNGGSGVGAFPDFTTTKAIAAQFDSTTANVADLTAGSVTFYIECVSY